MHFVQPDRHNGVMGVGTALGFVLAASLAACGVAPPASPSTRAPAPSSTEASLGIASVLPVPSENVPVPALTVSDPQVSVTPSGQLDDGQSVVVRVTGFGVGGKVWVSECATASSANDLGCGAQLAAQTLIATNGNRAGYAAFTIHAQAQAGPFNTGPIEVCSDMCVIVATLGGGFAFAYAGISFQGP
jgi:hypothetical protein